MAAVIPSLSRAFSYPENPPVSLSQRLDVNSKSVWIVGSNLSKAISRMYLPVSSFSANSILTLDGTHICYEVRNHVHISFAEYVICLSGYRDVGPLYQQLVPQ